MHRLNSLAALACCLMTLVSSQLVARDDGRFANSPLKEWFDRLASRNGLCCAFADGVTVQDVDWDTEEGHYRIRIQAQWLVVPDAAVVTEPNRFGAQPLCGSTTTVTATLKFAALSRERELKRGASGDQAGKYFRIDIAAGQHGDGDFIPDVDFAVHHRRQCDRSTRLDH